MLNLLSGEKNSPKKKKKSEEPAKKPSNKSFFNRIPGLKDIMCPPGFNRKQPDHLVIGSRTNGSTYCRSLVMSGYPSRVSVGWLDDIINYEGDIDTAVYLVPTDERAALDELTDMITKLEAQLDSEMERGYTRNVTRLKTQIDSLYEQRSKLEQHHENLFQVAIMSNLYATSLDELDKETTRLTTRLGGRHIIYNPLLYRQDDSYRSVLPFGTNYIQDMYRNFNSGSATSCFPFYSPEISHLHGVFVGINLATRPATPIYLDFYDRNIMENGNIAIIGQPGSGKTFLVNLITMRQCLRNVRTVILDPEGEYGKIVKYLGGAEVIISSDTKTHINPFDLEEEEGSAGEGVVNIKGKIADLLNFIGMLAQGVTPQQRSITATLLQEIYTEKGFTSSPDSLYKESYLSEEGHLVQYEKKPMPTLSDLYNKLKEYAKNNNDSDINKLADTLALFCRGNAYDLFDYQTSPELANLRDEVPVVCFNLNELEESILRPIGMNVALTWTWEKFAKKNPEQKKCIIADEGWMLLNKNMAGVEHTAKFVNTFARRIRKRNAIFVLATQNFVEFTGSEEGRAVLSSAMVHILLKQSSNDIEAVQDIFALSQGEKEYILSCKKGEGLLKIGHDISTNFFVKSFPEEKGLIEANTAQKD